MSMFITYSLEKKMDDDVKKQMDDEMKKIVELLALSWLDGARTTLKNWHYWTRSIPESQLIPHLDKLAKEHAEKLVKGALAGKEETDKKEV